WHIAGPRLDAKLRGIEVTAPRYFHRGESLCYDHSRAAVWAVPGAFVSIWRLWCRDAHGQLLPADSQLGDAESVRQKSEVANPDEAFRQYMQEESAQELCGAEFHLALLAAVSVVFPAECDVFPIERQQP